MVLPQLEEQFPSVRMEVEGHILRTESAAEEEKKKFSGFAAVCENFALQVARRLVPSKS